jgi:septum formation protein
MTAEYHCQARVRGRECVLAITSRDLLRVRSMMETLVLASASPRRRELLARVGIPIEVWPAAIDESVLAGEDALTYVCRVATAKIEAVAVAMPQRWILAADTVVEIDDAILGKAADDAEARDMLRRLVGRAHRVTTAFSLRGPGSSGERYLRDRTVTTEVWMRGATAAELDDYVRAGEWRGKAGAYAIQGMAAALVSEVRGSVTNVAGLPLAEVLEELTAAGVAAPRYQQGVAA